jgi:hypothetical protein
MSIYFIVDNKYSKELVIKLIRIVRNKFVHAGVVHVSRPVNVCSNKMGRFIREGLGEGFCVVIVVDTEGRSLKMSRLVLLMNILGTWDLIVRG